MTLRPRLATIRDTLFPAPDARPDGPGGRFMEAALERHKREGMELAVRARWLALAIFAVMLPMITSPGSVLYYEVVLMLLAVIGWLQLKAARVGRSRLEVLLIQADIVIFTVAMVVPNPFQSLDQPLAMQFRNEPFKYFYLFLAFGTLAYSWRTVRGIGSMTVIAWLAAVFIVWLVSTPDAALSAAAAEAFGQSPVMVDYLDPNSLLWWIRVQEVVVFVVIAWILSTTVRRFSRLVTEQAGLERERSNLARYFSPNVVDELSRNDEPLKRIRTQDVAVLFVDIVGFTSIAAQRPAEQVIETLRAFHARMEAEVFAHHGTLDKYLGDGLMATFGTPSAGESDARDALACARAMADAVTAWNAEREAAGEPPIRAGIGLHYGPAVLGDIGANRLEFAVIGDTVNIASRVEALTRQLDVRIAATDAAVERARSEGTNKTDPADGFTDLGEHPIRGLDRELRIWGLR